MCACVFSISKNNHKHHPPCFPSFYPAAGALKLAIASATLLCCETNRRWSGTRTFHQRLGSSLQKVCEFALQTKTSATVYADVCLYLLVCVSPTHIPVPISLLFPFLFPFPFPFLSFRCSRCYVRLQLCMTPLSAAFSTPTRTATLPGSS